MKPATKELQTLLLKARILTLKQNAKKTNNSHPKKPVSMNNKILIAVLVILGVFIVTNPTQTDFDRYVEGNDGLPLKYVRSGRTGYYLLFSTYRYSHASGEYYSKKTTSHSYIGVFKNFFQLY